MKIMNVTQTQTDIETTRVVGFGIGANNVTFLNLMMEFKGLYYNNRMMKDTKIDY